MTYSSEVLADSPLVYWKFDETSGTTATDLGSANLDGALGGSVTVGAAAVRPGGGGSSFDFASGFVYRTPATSALNGSAMTVEAWICPDAVDGYRCIIGRDNGRNFNLYIQGGKLWFDLTSAGVSLYGSTTLVPGTVYHVAASYDFANIRLYLNGAPDGSLATSAGSLSVNSQLHVGETYAGTGALAYFPFDGRISDVAYYGTALSAARIAAHYAAATGPAAITGTLAANLPNLTANLSGGIEFSGTIAAVLPTLGANLAGTSQPPGIAGDLSATLPPLGGSLAGAYSDTATLAAILPPMSANLASTYAPPPVAGTLGGTLPNLSANLVGQAFEPGTSGFLAGALPALSSSLSGDVLGREGFGLILDSSASLTVDDVLEPEPSVPAGTPSTVLHIIAPTVPVPTLVAGRPQ